MGSLNLGPTRNIKTNGIHFNESLVTSAHLEIDAIFQKLNTNLKGLDQAEVEKRLDVYGPNEVAKEKQRNIFERIFDMVKNPLVLLLSGLALISYLTGDLRATIVILVMVVLGIVLRYVQESRADNAAAKLKAMVTTTATVLRAGEKEEVQLSQIVPGDIVLLSVGDMVPADLRLISEKDLYINQSTLTGESQPVEKKPIVISLESNNPLEFQNICFMGSNIAS